MSWPWWRPGRMEPPYSTIPGIFSRSSAIAPPGMVLSQATSVTRPSNMWPRATSSIESAITSRLTRDAFIHLLGQRPQTVVAGHGSGPGVGDTDNWLLQIGVGESDGLQKGPGGS